jgi:hypothetical protein
MSIWFALTTGYDIFFSTGTILETRSAYWQGRMNPASSSRYTSSLMLLWIIELNLQVGCLYGLKPDLIGS